MAHSPRKKPVQHYSTAEKLKRRRAKRKQGPAAVRRRGRRLSLQLKPTNDVSQFETPKSVVA